MDLLTTIKNRQAIIRRLMDGSMDGVKFNNNGLKVKFTLESKGTFILEISSIHKHIFEFQLISMLDHNSK